MNERFEKLLANAFFDENADAADTKVYNLNDAVMQKFAESIVQECVGICDAYGMPDGTSQTAMILSLAIRKHFGVQK